MKAEVFAARAIALCCAVAIDMSTATGDAEWKARAALLTPIAKAFGTDTGIEVAAMGDAGAWRHGLHRGDRRGAIRRDVRVTAIYEGTNGIQAMDLVARKMMDGGEAAFRLLDEIEARPRMPARTLPDLAEAVWQAAEELRETTEWLVSVNRRMRFAGAVPYLRGFARVLGGHLHLVAALAGQGRSARTAGPLLHPAAAARTSFACLPKRAPATADVFALSPTNWRPDAQAMRPQAYGIRGRRRPGMASDRGAPRRALDCVCRCR